MKRYIRATAYGRLYEDLQQERFANDEVTYSHEQDENMRDRLEENSQAYGESQVTDPQQDKVMSDVIDYFNNYMNKRKPKRVKQIDIRSSKFFLQDDQYDYIQKRLDSFYTSCEKQFGVLVHVDKLYVEYKENHGRGYDLYACELIIA